MCWCFWVVDLDVCLDMFLIGWLCVIWVWSCDECCSVCVWFFWCCCFVYVGNFWDCGWIFFGWLWLLVVGWLLVCLGVYRLVWGSMLFVDWWCCLYWLFVLVVCLVVCWVIVFCWLRFCFCWFFLLVCFGWKRFFCWGDVFM